MLRPLVLSALIAGLGTAAAAKPNLRDVAAVREGLIAAGIAYEIGENCDGLSARLFQGLRYLNGLRDHARDLGYSDDEIDAFVDSRSEKRALEQEARARLRSMGAAEGQGDSYCAVGRAEIAQGSTVGQLLR